MKLAFAIAILALSGSAIARQLSGSDGVVPYPEGYRSWTHVKSGLIGPAHKNFATNGGFQHV